LTPTATLDAIEQLPTLASLSLSPLPAAAVAVAATSTSSSSSSSSRSDITNNDVKHEAKYEDYDVEREEKQRHDTVNPSRSHSLSYNRAHRYVSVCHMMPYHSPITSSMSSISSADAYVACINGDMI
jgi:hypothetical protein